MSVASEFAPEVYIPRQARTQGSSALALDPCSPYLSPRPRHLRVVQPADDWSEVTAVSMRAEPSALRGAEAAPRPLHLTRRGIAAIAGLVLAICATLVVLAWQFAPSPSAAPAIGANVAEVTVRPGDTLWSIASRVAPQRDPRDEIAHIQRLNGLSSVDVVAGQALRVR
jgi:hypothetical protein